MKKCSYCGAEYPDDAVRCLVDQEPLSDGPPPLLPPPPSDGVIAEITSPVTAELVDPATWTDQRLRVFELVLVCGVAFSDGVFSSIYHLGYPTLSSSNNGWYSWMRSSVHELVALGLLWYVLRRRSRTFHDLYSGCTWKDFSLSIPLWGVKTFASKGIFFLIYSTGLTSISRSHAIGNVTQHLFGGGISLATILFQFLNPFFEELIVRAYVMTEIKQLTNSTAKAVLISTALQTSYHLYQGVPLALSLGTGFLIYSLYYAKTNRIAPVILAHLYSDVIPILSYGVSHS